MSVDPVKWSECSTCTQPMSADLSYTHTHPVCADVLDGRGRFSAVFVAATVCITFLQENREFS